MPSRHLSVRIDPDTLVRLDAESRRTNQSRSKLAKTLLNEGLRMQAHPGIVFRPGPAGRRAALAGGPDIWEIVRVYQGIEGSGENAVDRIAELASLTPGQVHSALRYYSEYSDEIDGWLRELDAEAERAAAAWQREQELLRR